MLESKLFSLSASKPSLNTVQPALSLHLKPPSMVKPAKSKPALTWIRTQTALKLKIIYCNNRKSSSKNNNSKSNFSNNNKLCLPKKNYNNNSSNNTRQPHILHSHRHKLSTNSNLLFSRLPLKWHNKQSMKSWRDLNHSLKSTLFNNNNSNQLTN